MYRFGELVVGAEVDKFAANENSAQAVCVGAVVMEGGVAEVAVRQEELESTQ